MQQIAYVADDITPQDLKNSPQVNVSDDDLFLVWKGAELLAKWRKG